MNLEQEFKNRIRSVQRNLEAENLEALLVQKRKNLRYLTGRGTGRALITEDGAIVWVKDLYKELYSYPMEVRTYGKDAIKKFIQDSGIKKLGIEDLPYSRYEKFRQEIPSLAVSRILEQNRAIKSPYEVRLLRRAAGIAKKGMEKAYELIREGKRELDLVAEIEHEIRIQGSETPPFDDGMLLAAGKRGADIHAHCTGSRISKGDLVVVDLGANVEGYYSDMTRTLASGNPGKEAKELLEFVRDLEEEAIDALYVGMKAPELYEFVEKRIESRGHKFYHAAGHGIGLDIHELPTLSPESEDILRKGMVFTIEPGIYIPGKFGIRFEDMILLRKKAEVLTK